jgi:bacillithiol biosynthesis cysteine-adding enzyme BshC
MTSSFFSAWAAGDQRARGFLPDDFRQSDPRIGRTRAAAERAMAPELVAALRAQDALLPSSAARRAHLDALAAGGAAVVATGQQVGLFLGPLYTFYKAATAVVTARALERESGVRCVPLFWLQTEDHDFAEIDHCVVDAGLRVAITDGAAGRRVPVGTRRLGDDVTAALGRLDDALIRLPAAAATLALLGAHYRPGAPLGAAFAGLLAALFADEGLLVLDPRDPAVARGAAPVYRRALDGAAEIAGLLARQTERLAAAGFAAQVRVRADATLVCWLRDGERFRVTHAEAAAARPLADEPLGLSSSALLRPIVQDALLPTAAYVGGPAEIAYFAQLWPLYAAFDLLPPLLVPRARLRVVEPDTRRRLDALGLRPADVERPRDQLLGLPAAPPPSAVDELLGELPARLGALAADDHPALARALARTRATVRRAVERLVARAARARVERDAAAVERIDRLRAALYPDDTPQERVYGVPRFLGRYGAAPFKAAVLAAVRPFSTEIEDVEP